MELPFFAEKNHSFATPLGLELIALFGAFLALDIITTQQILQMGGAELNATMVTVVADPFLHGLVKSLFFVGILTWASWCEDQIPKAGMVILSAVSGWFLYVVAFNLHSLVAPLGF